MTVTITDILGPQLTTSQMTALGGEYAIYDAQFSTASDTLFANAAPGMPDVYYDLALSHYAAAERIRASDPARALVYESRGDAAAVYYRNLLDPPSMIVVFEAFPMGLAIHWLRTGDTNSYDAIAGLAKAMWYAWGQKSIFHAACDLNDFWDQRTMGRIMDCFLIAYLFDMSSVTGGSVADSVFTGTPGTQTVEEGTWMDPSPAWDAIIKHVAKYASENQSVDGSWLPQTYGYVQGNFNAGILLNILLDIDRFIPGIPTLRTTIQKAVDFLVTQWVPGQGFQYASGLVNGGADGDTTPAADVTGLMVTPVAWAAMNGSSTANVAFAEAVFAQTVTGAYLAVGKQFNQAYSRSYRTPYLLFATDPVPPDNPPVVPGALVDIRNGRNVRSAFGVTYTPNADTRMEPSRLMHPKIIYTQAYLNDSIQFAPDPRFDPETVLQEIEGEDIAPRDEADFFVGEVNTQKYIAYPIELIVSTFQRVTVKRVIDKTIKQLLPPEN